ncbi:hypothetical protein PoB_003021300 [Plakobranchus ocellatus]|uniref:Uncharacterized protein n=1 Tax=Plakobranchus ocellatus TaxID=259542 RepID=A0AAV4AAC6_9GAST|nr:hypothetical protein PoB_003021300 [Plakobranchus ocellatus]
MLAPLFKEHEKCFRWNNLSVDMTSAWAPGLSIFCSVALPRQRCPFNQITIRILDQARGMCKEEDPALVISSSWRATRIDFKSWTGDMSENYEEIN